jgi:hypothetical protein
LQWLADNQKEPEEQQLELNLENAYNSNQQLPVKRERVDGAVVNRDFREAIHHKGGDGQCQADSSVAMSQELFDMNPRQLYQQTRGKPYDRSTLPKEAQKAFIVGETVATHELNIKEIKGISQQDVNVEITDTVRGSAKKVRKLLPW